MTKRLKQKLISFTNQPSDLIKIEKEVMDGWNIISLAATGNNYVGIMEISNRVDNSGIFIPARKKIRIIS